MSNIQTKPTDSNYQERDFRMSTNCGTLWGTECEFEFGLEESGATTTRFYRIHIRRTINGNGGELLLLSGAHEDDENAWEEIDKKLIAMTEFVRKKMEKKAAEDHKLTKEMPEEKEVDEKWPAVGSGAVPARNSRGLVTNCRNGFGLRNTGLETNNRNGSWLSNNGGNDYGSRNYGRSDYESRNYGRSDYASRNYGENDYGSRSYARNGYGSRNDDVNNYGSRGVEEVEDGKKPQMSQDDRLALWGRIGERRKRG